MSLHHGRRRGQPHRGRLLGRGAGIHQRAGDARLVCQLLSTDLTLQVELTRRRLHPLWSRPRQRRLRDRNLRGGIGQRRPRCLQRQGQLAQPLLLLHVRLPGGDGLLNLLPRSIVALHRQRKVLRHLRLRQLRLRFLGDDGRLPDRMDDFHPGEQQQQPQVEQQAQGQ